MSGQFPIISLTVQGMKHEILAALTQHELRLSGEIKDAIEDALTPEAIRSVVEREVLRVVNEVIREEVERFYRNGAGRAIIRERIAALDAQMREPG